MRAGYEIAKNALNKSNKPAAQPLHSAQGEPERLVHSDKQLDSRTAMEGKQMGTTVSSK
jgi:hypothetical protein